METRALDRPYLEYHLDSLTKRKEETRFEHFCLALCQREICPNLIPQTGPTGGGDSKVDTETYPVSDTTSLTWHEGIGREAASERWAFAFSAKREWAGKVRSDVEKISGTGRGYTRVFFVSNQAIPDKARARTEDELTARYGFEVRILDLAWILDRVFRNGHERIACDTLGIDIPATAQVRMGPTDTAREQHLSELEERIREATAAGRITFATVDECLEAAVLAAYLERPREAFDGLITRALRVAGEQGSTYQQLSAAYKHAWLAYFWYEDACVPNRMYDEVEAKASGSRNAYELELLTNLWHILPGAVRTGRLEAKAANLKQRTARLKGELRRLAREVDRKSTSLMARECLLRVELLTSPERHLGDVLLRFKEIIAEGAGLVGFPLDPLAQSLLELGDFIGHLPEYDAVFEAVVAAQSASRSEAESADLLLRRAEQHFEAGNPYETLRLAGRALASLYKHEKRGELVHALCLCSQAYERAGLLWAARGTIVGAASVAADEFYRYQQITKAQLLTARRGKWLELQLGRLPHVLAWYEWEQVLMQALREKGEDVAAVLNEHESFDVILGLLLLKAEAESLRALEHLPEVLEHMGLPASSIALRFALGYEAEIKEEGFKDDPPEAVQEHFLRWIRQPAAEDLPGAPHVYNGTKVLLSTRVLGCEVIAEADNEVRSVQTAESLLASVEAFLATVILEDAGAREPRITLRVRESKLRERGVRFELTERDGLPHAEVVCGQFNPHRMTVEEQGALQEQIREAVLQIVARIITADDPERLLTRLLRDDLALQRAVPFSTSYIVTSNVLGDSPKLKITDWTAEGAGRYPLLRPEPWTDGLPRDADVAAHERPRPTLKAEPPPPELFERERFKHNQMRVDTIIRDALWDRAGWLGMGYVIHPEFFPVLAPMFKDREAALKIFDLWRAEIGDTDEREVIRISVIRGVDAEEPGAYRVLIGANPEAVFEPDIRYVTYRQRIHTIDGSASENMERFLTALDHWKAYVFAPMIMSEGSREPTRPYVKRGILKRAFSVREAWEIGPHDLDAISLKLEDNPILPPDAARAPVTETLLRKRERRKGKGEV